MKSQLLTLLFLLATTSIFGNAMKKSLLKGACAMEIDVDVMKSDSIFPIGTKWTYEWREIALPNFIGYVEFEITDTVRSNDSLIYIIENNRTHPEIKMYQESDKIYLFDPFANTWQLTYDFMADDSYNTQYYDPFDATVKTTEVKVEIDPTLAIELGDRGTTQIQKITVVENGSQDIPLHFNIVDNIGKMNGGLSLELGLGLHDPPYTIGHLRCFEEGDFSFNFSSIGNGDLVPCDNEQFISSISTLADKTIQLYPNPVSDQLFLKHHSKSGVDFQIYAMDGTLMNQGHSDTSLDVAQLPKGMYLIMLKQGANPFAVNTIVKY